jgi:hypothetical protein
MGNRKRLCHRELFLFRLDAKKNDAARIYHDAQTSTAKRKKRLKEAKETLKFHQGRGHILAIRAVAVISKAIGLGFIQLPSLRFM